MQRNAKRQNDENPKACAYRVREEQRLRHARKRAYQIVHVLHRQARFRMRRKRRQIRAHHRKRLRKQKLDEQEEHRRAANDRGNGNEIIPHPLINAFRVIAMAHVTQNAVFIVYLKELDLVDFMAKHNAHKRVAKLVYGRADKARCITNPFAIIDKRVKISIQKGDDEPHPVHYADKKGDL